MRRRHDPLGSSLAERLERQLKLHAPKNTTVKGRVKNGKLADLKVTPASRRKDVVFEGEKKI